MILLEVIAALALLIVFYATKRYFDERVAARLLVHGLSQTLMNELVACRTEVSSNTGLVRERLTVFEKALANAIAQFAEIVKETRQSELESRAKTAGAAVRLGRRMPTP